MGAPALLTSNAPRIETTACSNLDAPPLFSVEFVGHGEKPLKKACLSIRDEPTGKPCERSGRDYSGG